MERKEIIGKWTVEGTDSANGRNTGQEEKPEPTAAAVRASFSDSWAHLRD